jgi:hypothetical protein
MMFYKNLYTIFAALLSSSVAQAELVEFNINKNHYQLEILNGSVSVKKDSIEILRKAIAIDSEQAAFVMDFNFDTYPDFAVLRESGIERYFDVYLFDKRHGNYLFNKPISALACPSVNSKSKLILSTCNHANSCESWRDSYRYKNGRLLIIRRDGTTCDPATGQTYKYFETYKNGRISKHDVTPIEQ